MSTTRRILVLGAAPADARPETHIMAGPCCFAGQEDRFPGWESAFTFAPSPFAGPDDLANACDEAHTYAITRIDDIALRLGAHHGVDLPRPFWEFFLIPWLALASQAMVERQRRVLDLIRVFGDEELEVTLLPRECSFSFETTHDFVQGGALNAEYNHWVLSRILEDMLPRAWRVTWGEPVVRHAGAPEPVSVRSLLKRIVYALPFPHIKGFSLGQILKFSAALMANRNTDDRTMPLERLKGRNPAWKFDPDKVLLPAIPRSFFNVRLPRRVKPGARHAIRAVSVGCYYDDVYRARLALARARGTRLVFLQHGGNYGHVRTYGTSPVFEYPQHAFLTWGWEHHTPCPGNFVPTPHAQLDKLKGKHAEKDPNLILVGAEMGLFNYRLDSKPQPLEYLDYRADKSRFLAALPDALRGHTLYRPYFDIPGALADAPWVLERHPDVKRCVGSLDEHMLACRLLVLDHHGTTLELAMAADVPLILFWNTQHWQMCPETEEALGWLEQAGIFHRSPESAAAHAAKVWHDVEGWWQSPLVRATRHQWCNRYARLVDEENTTQGRALENCWMDLLRKL